MDNDKIKFEKEIKLIALEELFRREGTLPDYLFEVYQKLKKEVANEDCKKR